MDNNPDIHVIPATIYVPPDATPLLDYALGYLRYIWGIEVQLERVRAPLPPCTDHHPLGVPIQGRWDVVCGDCGEELERGIAQPVDWQPYIPKNL
jgi:hypothetical protein